MAKKTAPIRKRSTARNWIAYLCEALVTSGVMPKWEAATYLTENLFGEKPNPRLLSPSTPHEATSQLLQRLYQPIAEAASREISLPAAARLHAFTDISLTGNSAVLVVYFPGPHHPQHLLLLDAVKAWDLVFVDADSFNSWAEERYRSMLHALQNVVVTATDEVLSTAV